MRSLFMLPLYRHAVVFLTALLLAPLTVLQAADTPKPPSNPNILFILTDDEGLSDVGCYGSDRFKGKTPNLDALAATGVRFTHCFAPPLCCPSHTTLPASRRRFSASRTWFRRSDIFSPNRNLPSRRSR